MASPDGITLSKAIAWPQRLPRLTAELSWVLPLLLIGAEEFEGGRDGRARI